MSSRLLSFVVWAAVAASAVFWGLRLFTHAPAAPAHAVTVSVGVAGNGADLSRLLGAAPAAPSVADVTAPLPVADSRFRLHGVVAARNAATSSGLALISVDGKPARPYGVGAALDTGLVLIAVGHRAVEIGPRGGPAQIKLELAALPEAARSTLPPPGPSAAATAPRGSLPPPVAVPPAAASLPPAMAAARNAALAAAAPPAQPPASEATPATR